MSGGDRHRQGGSGGRLYLPHEAGTVLGPDGEPVSRGEARRRARDKEQRQCELPECEGERERRLPNGVEVCEGCWEERRVG